MGQPRADLPTPSAPAAAPFLPATRPPVPPASSASGSGGKVRAGGTAPAPAATGGRPTAVRPPRGAGPPSAALALAGPAVLRVSHDGATAGAAGDGRVESARSQNNTVSWRR